MKKVAVITHIPFWRHHAGHAARLSALVEFFGRYTELSVVFGGYAMRTDAELLRKHPYGRCVVYLDKYRILSPIEYSVLFGKYLKSNPVHVCIVEYLKLSFVLDYIPRGIKVMLDTHDIVSERSKSFRQYFLQTENVLVSQGEVEFVSEEAEFALFNRYDKIILINQTDYYSVSRVIGTEKSILAPHPVKAVKHPTRAIVSTIGYVASEYWPNIDAISIFLAQVWPHVFQKCTEVGQPISLNIYGNIGTSVNFTPHQGIKVNGYVADLNDIYREVDIVINPIRFGAGIKIKNLEALGHGLPLVTTPHGARGLEAGINRAFLVAEDSRHFCDLLIDLINSYERRQILSNEALQFIKSHFTPEICFQQLLYSISSI